MLIGHVSDVHIRLLKRHREYEEVFKNLYESLTENKVDRIVLAGDVFHNKVNLSPEAIRLGKDFFDNLVNIAPLDIIVGNHDCIVNQPGRLDVITAIIDMYNEGDINGIPTVYGKSGVYEPLDTDEIAYGVFAINDEKNFPTEFERKDGKKYIALFHGAMNSAKTDVNYVLKSNYHATMFKNYDIGMLGDIHKYQAVSSFENGNPKVLYSGSLIQQDFGEGGLKGYVIWDTDDFSSRFQQVKNPYGYYTIRLNPDEDITKRRFIDVPEKPYVRVLVEGDSYNQVTLSNIASYIRERLNPLRLSVEVDVASSGKNMDLSDLEVDNVSQLPVQQKLIKKYFKGIITDEDIDKIIAVHSEIFNSSIEEETKNRGSSWQVKSIKFDNTFSYGEDNYVDFQSLNGIVGMFSPNRSGKSAMLRTLLNGLFNMSDKVSRTNITDLINENRDHAEMEIRFAVDNKDFIIRRRVDRLKQNRNKGKTIIRLWEVIAGEEVAITGDSNVNETEKIIRGLLGTYLDHSLTTFGMQGKLANFIDGNQSERKEQLARFLGLDIMDNLYLAIKGECDTLKRVIRQYKEHDFKSIHKGYEIERKKTISKLEKATSVKAELKIEITAIIERIGKLNKSLKNIEDNNIDKKDIEIQISSSQDHIKKLKELLKHAKLEHISLNTNIKDSEVEIKTYNEDKLKESLASYRSACNELDTINRDKLLIKKDISNANKLTTNLTKHDWFETEENCQKCVFLSDAFKAKDSLENMGIKEEDLLEKEKIYAEVSEKHSNAQREWDDYMKCTQSFSNDIRSLEVKKMEIANREDSIVNVQETLKQQQRLLLDYKNNKTSIEYNKSIKKEIENINKDLPGYKKKLEDVDVAISTWNINLGSVNQKIEDLSNSIEQMNQVEDKFRLASLLKDALSKDGIQLQITKKVIPRINMEIRKILSHISGFDVLMEIDDITHDVGIFIDDGSSKRKLDLGSGMESVIGAISIRAALANISLIPRCNLFVIDEGFGALDSDNLNNMNNLLGYLKSIFNTVIIISHIDSMMDLVDHQIHVEKTDEGYSKIKVGEEY